MQAMLLDMLEKYLGRYFLAWAFSAAAFWTQKLSQDNFMWVTVAYMGGGATAAVCEAMKNKSSP